MICPRSECPGPGEIDDGYCNVCGLAPPTQVAPTPPDAPVESRDTGSMTKPIRARGRSAVTRSGTTRARFGAGLVEITTPERRDPLDTVMEEPCVPEHQRYCVCGHPVGRGRYGEPGRTEGFCPRSGHPFSFTPKLVAGDLVAGQYEIAGCLAHGGLGWIYLARDRKVSDRWVVLKGVLNTNDSDALAVALAERRFLAEVEHPNIVKIHNFVEYAHNGYIVMEYVPGSSLRHVLERRKNDNGGLADPLPVTEAIAYILEILPALGYLHDEGLLYCDLKPDNIIQSPSAIKLIDLGAVHRVDDLDSSVYGTVGYQAPEVGEYGPSVASDLFTVGRTLAVLASDFSEFRGARRFTLADPGEVPLYRQYDSLYRVLLRATAPNPDERFQSADEMSEQLVGVLREVVASETGSPASGVSKVFSTEVRAAIDAPDPVALPVPLVRTDDPAAAFLAALPSTEPSALLEFLDAAPEFSIEVDLRKARTLIECERVTDADDILDAIDALDPWDWRALWFRAVGALMRGDHIVARSNFTAVYEVVPGELAPRLALASALECLGETGAAAGWYAVVCRTDANFPSAAFGLARCLARAGDRMGAVAALDRVPATSASYVDAQVAKAKAILAPGTNGESPDASHIVQAAAVVDRVALDDDRRAQLTAAVLEEGLALVLREGSGPEPVPSLFGWFMTEHDLRLGLEATYRASARRAPTAAERIALVDRANQVRPMSLT